MWENIFELHNFFCTKPVIFFYFLFLNFYLFYLSGFELAMKYKLPFFYLSKLLRSVVNLVVCNRSRVLLDIIKTQIFHLSYKSTLHIKLLLYLSLESLMNWFLRINMPTRSRPSIRLMMHHQQVFSLIVSQERSSYLSHGLLLLV